MRHSLLKSDLLLLLTATIWGFAFVAQRVGMAYVGPFTFNGVRFALGCLVLIPFIIKGKLDRKPAEDEARGNKHTILVLGGGLAGLFLFGGASFQQIGLVYTTAGNAGFITGLYVVIVPVLGLLGGQRATTGTWLGAMLAAFGLFLLSVKGDFSIGFGDMLELVGAFLWACHVLVIGWLTNKTSALKLAFLQFAVCSLLSLCIAAWIETIAISGLVQAAAPIAYGGLLSVGVAYTLQVIAQREAHPAHASILLSLEAVFAAAGGWLILNETLSFRGMTGCALMLAGMLLSQLWGKWWQQ